LLDRIRWTRSRRDWVLAGLLGLAIAVAWMGVCGLLGAQRFSDPISYWGDAWFTAAAVAAASRGDFFPFTSKLLPSLGAPFVANWNDFPGTDDMVLWLTGLIARLSDTIVAINVGFMLACVSSGLSLFFVARRYGFRRDGSLMAGFLFGMAYYIFVRGVHHYSLTFIGLLPWNVLVMSYLGSRRGLPWRSRRFALAAVTTVLTGWSFVYYIFFAAQLYVLGTVAGLMRHGRRFAWPPVLALAAIFAVAVLSVSTDFLLHARAYGSNPSATARQPTEVEYYALKPLAFFIPGGNHPLPFLRHAAQRAKAQSIVHGEEPAPFLGLAGGPLLIALALAAMAALARRSRPGWVVAFAATTAWFIIAHAVGGLNSVMGLFQMVLFRSMNRASAVVLTLVLLFSAWAVPRALRRLPALARWAACLAVASLSVVDLSGASGESLQSNRQQADSDRHLAAALETALPHGSLVFQLPPMDFPEAGPVHALGSYELFRPYLFSATLRFSHGDTKGRPNAAWKYRVAGLPAPELLAELRRSGFASVLVARKGYPDGGNAVLEGLRQAGARLLLVSEVGDTVALALP
jgi:phosphoglycerol transferase